MRVSRRGLFGFLAGLSGLAVFGRTKHSESKQEWVPGEKTGQKLYAVSDWACGRDVAVTVVYWRDAAGDYYIKDMFECTSEQIEDDRCPCRRYFPELDNHREEYLSDRLHFKDIEARYLDAGGEFGPWGPLVIPVKI